MNASNQTKFLYWVIGWVFRVTRSAGSCNLVTLSTNQLMLIQDQFGTIKNLQTFSTLAASYSKRALKRSFNNRTVNLKGKTKGVDETHHSPSGCAIFCIAVGEIPIGIEMVWPSTLVFRFLIETSIIIRGMILYLETNLQADYSICQIAVLKDLNMQCGIYQSHSLYS